MQQKASMGMTQQLGMTPQLAQSIRLLQLSSMELSAELEQALDDNLLLEREDEDDAPIEARDDLEEGSLIEPYGGARGGGEDYDEDRHAVAEQSDVHMRILEQAQLSLHDSADRLIACEICAATDDSGYLGDSVEVIAERCAATEAVELSRVERVLSLMQRMEPVGYASRSLAECLRVQLEDRLTSGQGDAQLVQLALALVEDHLDDMAAKRWTALAHHFGVPVETLLQAVGIVRALNPKPAAEAPPSRYVSPDVRVDKDGQGWVVRLNERAIPRLRVNAEYARAVESDRDARALKDQLQEARWLLRSVQVRQDTLLAATQAIFRRQSAFLSRGEVGLVPLTLKEIAEEIGVHESTLSRITTSKYVQTPRGMHSLKHFFPSQLQSAEGVSASGASVKAVIRRLIDAEPAEQPLRDVDIAAILARKGVSIARRTVAKYREAMNIGSSAERLAARRMLGRGGRPATANAASLNAA